MRSVLINQTPEFKLEDKAILDKYPVKMLSTSAQVLKFNDKGELAATPVRINLIPYYAWNHRGRGSMLVWIPQELRACTPAMPPTLASRSTVKASHMVAGLGAINDRLVPKGPEDRSVPYYHYWPKQGGTEWIEYHFPIIGPSRAVRSGLNITSPRLTPSRVPPSIGSTILHGVAARFLPDGASSTSRPMASGPR